MIDFESLLPAHSATAGQAEFRARLIQILNSQGEILPAAESPLGRLWQLVHSENSTIEECVDVIALDPALTSRVFRLANSVAYEGHVKTLKEALFFLGLSEIRQVAFNAGVFAQFSKIKLPAGWNQTLPVSLPPTAGWRRPPSTLRWRSSFGSWSCRC